MKTKLFFLPILALTATFAVSAQQIESDDMYFTSKDRAKQKASYSASLSANNDIVAKGIKSSDQYSGRSVNPEYTSRLNANSKSIQGSSNPYFDSGYSSRATTSNYYNNGSYYGNNSFYNNPYNSWNNRYSNLYGYSGMYGYSPYSGIYSPFYSPYGYGYMNGLNMSMGFGNSFYSPFGYNPMMMGYGYSSMMMGYGMGFGSYYGGFSPYYGMGMGFGNYYGGYPAYYGYSGTVDNSGSNITYGKRSSRSSIISNSVVPSNRPNITSATTPDQNGQNVIPISGRSSTQYYQPNWRSNPDVISNTDSGTRGNGSSYNRSQSLGTQNPSWNSGNTTRQSQTPIWNNNNSNNTRQSIPNSFESPSRGSSTPSWGGGGGFSGGSTGGSGGGGGSAPSRGR